jgi:hypothetical protein
MPDLKLHALDAEDLAVVSANCQDAVVQAADIAYMARDRRFALVCNRFDWLAASAARNPIRATAKPSLERRRAGLRFESVTRVQSTGFDPKASDAVLVLLAIGFDPKRLPGGVITLQFANGAAIRLDVDTIEAELNDLGAAWTTRNKPDHTPEPTD